MSGQLAGPTLLRRTLLCGGALAFAGGLTLRALAAAPASSEAELTGLARALYPHPSLPDVVYANIVRGIVTTSDEIVLLAAAEPYRRALASPGPGDETGAVQSFLSTPTGQAFRVQVLIGLYGDLNVTRTFGYPGPSLPFGGYLDHGFNDLNWLPEPTTDLHG